MSVIPMLDLPKVSAAFGVGRSQTYKFIENKLLTRPVKVSKRSLWPEPEIAAIQQARIAGKSDEEIRALCKKLMAERVA